MTSEKSNTKDEKIKTNLKALLLGFFAVALIYGLFAAIANATGKWQILFPTSTGSLTAVAGFIVGFYIYDDIKHMALITLVFSGTVALLNLAVMKGVEIFNLFEYAPALVFAFGFVCCIMGYGLSLPLRKKSEGLDV